MGSNTVEASTEHYVTMQNIPWDQEYPGDPDTVYPLDDDLIQLERITFAEVTTSDDRTTNSVITADGDRMIPRNGDETLLSTDDLSFDGGVAVV